MTVNIDSLNRSEALRYLSCHDEEAASSIPGIDECERELLKFLRPSFIYRYFDISVKEDEVKVEGSKLVLKGKDISKHLQNCYGAYLIAATLGPEADRLIRKMQITDMAKAVITDAFASAAIEQVRSEEHTSETPVTIASGSRMPSSA